MFSTAALSPLSLFLPYIHVFSHRLLLLSPAAHFDFQTSRFCPDPSGGVQPTASIQRFYYEERLSAGALPPLMPLKPESWLEISSRANLRTL